MVLGHFGLTVPTGSMLLVDGGHIAGRNRDLGD